MELVINDTNLRSEILSSLFLQQNESTATNDSGSLRILNQNNRLVKVLREFSGKPKIKGFWDSNFQPFMHPAKICQSDSSSLECSDFEDYTLIMKTFLNLEDNWDSYGAEAPSANSFNKAKKTIAFLESINFPPTKLLPSVEGGISFLFIRGNKYADIECDNDGDVICGLSDRENEPEIWEVGADKTNLYTTVEKIRDFFRK